MLKLYICNNITKLQVSSIYFFFLRIKNKKIKNKTQGNHGVIFLSQKKKKKKRFILDHNTKVNT